MRRTTNDVLAGKQPVAPAEAPNMVQGLQEQHGRLRVLDCVFAHAEVLGLLADVGKELAVWKRPIGAELVKDLCEWSRRHGDFTEVIQEGNLFVLVSEGSCV